MSQISSRGIMRIVLIVTVLAGAVGLQSAGRGSFSKRDKAYYAKPEVINFVRPGLVFKVSSASIAGDGTITARVLVTDPQGLPLDRLGVDTPGTISMSFIAATIPNGQKQYTSYTTRTVTGGQRGRYRHPGRCRFGRVVHKQRRRRLYLYFQDQSASRLRPDRHSHRGCIRQPEPDQLRAGDELRVRDIELRAEWLASDGNARRGARPNLRTTATRTWHSTVAPGLALRYVCFATSRNRRIRTPAIR